MTNDRWAWAAICGTGPAASSPPTSQTTSMPWARPAMAPASRSRPLRTPSPRPTPDPGPDARSDRLADPDRREQRHEHGDGAQGGLEALEQVVGVGQREDDDDPTHRGPGEAQELREEPRAPARDEPEPEEDDDPDVDQVHLGSIDEDGEARPPTTWWVSAGRSGWVRRPRRRRSCRSPDRARRGRRQWP